jgi:hypothetical protein
VEIAAAVVREDGSGSDPPSRTAAGTYVGHERVAERTLTNGDAIRLGESILAFLTPDDRGSAQARRERRGVEGRALVLVVRLADVDVLEEERGARRSYVHWLRQPPRWSRHQPVTQ